MFVLDEVDAAAAQNRRPLFEFRDIIKDGYVRKALTSTPYMPDPTVRYTLVVDLGVKNDPTALTLLHRDQDKVILDCVTTWKPDPDAKVIVDLNNVEEMIIEICRCVTIEGVYGDHWQSSLMMQKLRGRGINANVAKVDFDDYQVFKRLLYGGGIILLNNGPLLKEIKDLQLYSGRKVDHPEGGHNDMASCLVMGVKILTKIGKSAQLSSNLAAEGEYVGENMHEAVAPYEQRPSGMDAGIVIDGIPL